MTSKEWKEYKIGTICEVLSSKRIFAADYVETGIPFYRSKEIIQKSLGENIEEKLYISKEGASVLKVTFNWIIPALILVIGLFVWLRRRGR